MHLRHLESLALIVVESLAVVVVPACKEAMTLNRANMIGIFHASTRSLKKNIYIYIYMRGRNR